MTPKTNATLPPFITDAERSVRLENLRNLMTDGGPQAIILTPGSNLQYFFGLKLFESERFIGAIITQTETVFICPNFEDASLAAKLKRPYETLYWEEDEDPYAIIASHLSAKSVSQCAIDPNCSYGHASRIGNALGGAIGIGSADAQIAPLRSRKSTSELALMTCAKQLTLAVHLTISRWIKPGMASTEVKHEIDRLHRAAGADNGSSFCAVQFGEATAYPHGVPGDPVLQPGELILIDTGCQIDGYNSDITRTYALDTMSEEIETMWALEKEAQQAAFDRAGPGVLCEEVDAAARDVLVKRGLGPEYKLPGLPHRTGHGIGLDIHEGPYLVRGDKTVLAEGMCFSNEPMIVVPGKFGIRLEDHFYIAERGAAWFTDPQQSLYSLMQ
ncbi:MAG: Xaa-Pro peptidase family protein [Erythrobacter sp.]